MYDIIYSVHTSTVFDYSIGSTKHTYNIIMHCSEAPNAILMIAMGFDVFFS